MIGSGMPMSQSNTPFPKDMAASVCLVKGLIRPGSHCSTSLRDFGWSEESGYQRWSRRDRSGFPEGPSVTRLDCSFSELELDSF
jgi:hypothetical protein